MLDSIRQDSAESRALRIRRTRAQVVGELLSTASRAMSQLMSSEVWSVTFASKAFESIKRNHRRRETIRILMALDDHVLSDIGLERGEIPETARQLAARPPPSTLEVVTGRATSTSQSRLEVANGPNFDAAA